jgi:rhodanese-related sulfurtransferase
MTDVLITAGELADLITKEPCVIIDTRNPDAYGLGHIPNAVNVHEIFTYLATSTPDGMAELKTKFADAFGAAGLSGNETAVVYEQSMNSGWPAGHHRCAVAGESLICDRAGGGQHPDRCQSDAGCGRQSRDRHSRRPRCR